MRLRVSAPKETPVQNLKLTDFLVYTFSQGKMIRSQAPFRVEQSAQNYEGVSKFISTEGAAYIGVAFSNNGTAPFSIASAQIDSSPLPKTAVVIRAAGSLKGLLKADAAQRNVAWIPLPLDYATQVPLHFEISSTPPKLIKRISYKSDRLGNWGATLELNQTAASNSPVEIRWSASVLTQLISASEHSKYYSFPTNANEWLAASEIVQSTAPEVKSVSAAATANKLSPLEKALAVTNWTSHNIQYRFHPHLDALSALKERATTCTGYANLAAAIGRAVGIPTMTLAGYLVGPLHETHWVNQFYVGPQSGWFRAEPESVYGTVQEDEFVPVRMDTVADEVRWDSTFGIPANSYPAAPITVPPIVQAEVITEFLIPKPQMDDAFMRLRKQWQKDAAKMFSSGSISRERLQLRAQLENSKHGGDFEQAVRALENAN